MQPRIPLADIERLQRELDRFLAVVDRVHPTYWESDRGECHDLKLETIRNAATASAHVGGWIQYRRNHRIDPDDPLVENLKRGEKLP